MSQASHNDPERYYQEALHRVPATDAYRNECRDEQEDDSMDTDAIENCIVGSEWGKWSGQNTIDDAREQLDALIANQIPGRCGDCACNGGAPYSGWCKRPIGPVDHVNSDHYCSYFTKREA